MTEQKNSDGDKHDPEKDDQDSNREAIGQAVNPPQQQNSTSKQKQDTADPNRKPSVIPRMWRTMWRQRHTWRRLGGHQGPNWAEKTTVILTAGIVATGLFQGYIYWRQSQTMQASVEQTERGVIVGLGQMAVSARNARAAEDANRESRERFREEQRPYLWVDPLPGFADPDDPNHELKRVVANMRPDGGAGFLMQVTIKNGGRSPAIQVIATNTEFRIGKMAEVRKRVMGYAPNYTRSPSGVIVAIGSSLVPGTKRYDLTKEELTGIFDGTYEAYMVGGVTYRDVFVPKLVPYETTYCFRFNPIGMPFSGCPFKPPAFGDSIK